MRVAVVRTIMIPLKDTRLPSVRLSQEELNRLLKAADLAGERPSEFIRKALDKEVSRLARRHPELEKAA